MNATMTMQKTQVLYIEDNHLNIRLVEKSLRAMGYDIQTAQDGDEGLRAASITLPNLILLDMNLPTVDGITVLQSLKANPATSNIPVIILTADTTLKTQRLCQEHGADAYLNKPVSRSQLLRTIQLFVTAPQ